MKGLIGKKPEEWKGGTKGKNNEQIKEHRTDPYQQITIYVIT